MKISLIIAAASVAGALSFTPTCTTQLVHSRPSTQAVRPLQSSPEPADEAGGSVGDEPAVVAAAAAAADESAPKELTPEEEESMGNLVADEEWAGLSMELADVVRTAVVEDLKKNSRDFLGKDEYIVGDFSKESESHEACIVRFVFFCSC